MHVQLTYLAMHNPGKKVFLTAQWRNLVMLNYEVESAFLTPLVPAGTELDSWNGRFFVSVVGFMFLETRVFGWSIPFHRDFEEVNLRFYVRRKAPEGWRRGVVFIKEIVPRAAIALVARGFYNEPYVALPMSHRMEADSGLVKVQYSWRLDGRQNSLNFTGRAVAQKAADGSEAEFITEHYWGYNRQRNGATLEYRVEHPRWQTNESVAATLDCDVVRLYGARFADCLSQKPSSAFLADGSEVTVRQGGRL